MATKRTDARKRVMGTYRADRDRETADAPRLEPLMPEHLPEAARRIWRKKASALLEAGLLSSLDTETFGLYCVLAARLEADYAAGETPSRDLMTHFRPLAKAFGLDPEARSRIGVANPDKRCDHNPFDDLGAPPLPHRARKGR